MAIEVHTNVKLRWRRTTRGYAARANGVESFNKLPGDYQGVGTGGHKTPSASLRGGQSLIGLVMDLLLVPPPHLEMRDENPPASPPATRNTIPSLVETMGFISDSSPC